MNSQPLNVALLDRDTEFLERIRTMLESSSGVISSFSALADFLDEEGVDSRFDIILCSLELRDSHGTATFARIQEVCPALPKIVFTADEDCEVIDELLELGALDCLSKHFFSPDVLSRAIHFCIAKQMQHQQTIAKSKQMEMASKLAHLGNWEVEMDPLRITWSDEIRQTHEVDPHYTPDLDGALDFYIPEHRAEVERRFSACAEKGLPFAGEWQITTGKGNLAWVRVMGDCMRDDQGRVTKVYGTLQEVTEMLKDRANLKLFRQCVRHINDTILICDARELDEPGPRIIFVNEAFERLTGYTADEVIGRSPRFLQGPGTDPKVLAEIRHALRDAVSIRRELLNYGKDGKPHWVEMEISPVFDANGGVQNFVGIQRDITERKEEESKASFQARIMDTVSQSVLVTDPQGMISYANRKAEEYFGLPSDELVGQLVTEATVADEALDAANTVLRNVQNGEDWTGEILAKNSDGSTFPVLCSACAVYDQEGNIDKMLAFATDISERRSMEEALRRSLKDNLDLKQALDRHAIVAITDADGLAIFANRKYFEICALPEVKLIGKPLSLLSPTCHSPESLKDIVSVLHSGQAWSGEIRDRTAGGAHYWLNATIFPIFGASGSLESYLFLCSDITDRKKAERELQFQASFISRSNDAILAHGLDGGINFWNESAVKLYGWTPEEAIGKDILDLLVMDPDEYEKAVTSVGEGGEWNGEMRQKAQEGHEVLVEATWTLVEGGEGYSDSIFVICRDITETRELEKQFYRSQRMESVGRLAGGIAHDLNNMLTPISMAVGMLQQEKLSEGGITTLDLLKGSVNRASGLVKQVLMYSKGVDGNRVPVRLKELFDEIETMVRETFPRNISFSITQDRAAQYVLGDRTQIHQILMNLCVNARDAMSKSGGYLTIHAKSILIDARESETSEDVSEGPHVLISVRDTGAGIPADVVERIFEPFFTTKEAGKGSGLGLSTCLAIVKAHHGYLDVQSQPGEGTVFQVTLPSAAKGELSLNGDEETQHLPRGQGELILLVDDEAAICNIGKRLLEHSGYQVLTAHNGAEGAALFAKNLDEIRLVVTDMAMPVMDGHALIVALRTMRSNIPIVVTSGHTNSGRYSGEEGPEIEHFVPKPYSVESLVPTIASILAAEQSEALVMAG